MAPTNIGTMAYHMLYPRDPREKAKMEEEGTSSPQPQRAPKLSSPADFPSLGAPAPKVESLAFEKTKWQEKLEEAKHNMDSVLHRQEEKKKRNMRSKNRRRVAEVVPIPKEKEDKMKGAWRNNNSSSSGYKGNSISSNSNARNSNSNNGNARNRNDDTKSGSKEPNIDKTPIPGLAPTPAPTPIPGLTPAPTPGLAPTSGAAPVPAPPPPNKLPLETLLSDVLHRPINEVKQLYVPKRKPKGKGYYSTYFVGDHRSGHSVKVWVWVSS